MMKIDLHIHTIPTISDSQFKFNSDILEKYVKTQQIDCIAITNHNKFDLTQFIEIQKILSIYILPGIEINIDTGHLLLIDDNKNPIDFDEKCRKVDKLITTSNDSISIEHLKDIFGDLSKYLLIPHYMKDPVINSKVIEDLLVYINAGEVNSIKKFIYCIKDPDRLVPVIFSDVRIDDNLTEFPIRQTYVDLEEISLNGLKLCLRDKNKVAISKDDGHKLFQVLDNKLYISTGLNVMFGERSSGKTYTLNAIAKKNENVKYIKQFSLLETDEDAAKKDFMKQLNTKQCLISHNYLKEFKEVIDDVLTIDLNKNDKAIDEYVASLKKYAMEIDIADAFSKATLFNESEFIESIQTNLLKVIEAIVLLIENIEYRVVLNKYLSEENLKRLVYELMTLYTKEEESNLKKRWLNDLIVNIKKALG